MKNRKFMTNEYIEKYFSNQLSGSELEEFRDAISKDPVLAEKVEDYKDFRDRMQEDQNEIETEIAMSYAKGKLDLDANREYEKLISEYPELKESIERIKTIYSFAVETNEEKRVEPRGLLRKLFSRTSNVAAILIIGVGIMAVLFFVENSLKRYYRSKMSELSALNTELQKSLSNWDSISHTLTNDKNKLIQSYVSLLNIHKRDSVNLNSVINTNSEIAEKLRDNEIITQHLREQIIIAEKLNNKNIQLQRELLLSDKVIQEGRLAQDNLISFEMNNQLELIRYSNYNYLDKSISVESTESDNYLAAINFLPNPKLESEIYKMSQPATRELKFSNLKMEPFNRNIEKWKNPEFKLKWESNYYQDYKLIVLNNLADTVLQSLIESDTLSEFTVPVSEFSAGLYYFIIKSEYTTPYLDKFIILNQ